MKQRGEILFFAIQFPFSLIVKEKIICVHEVDFYVALPDGRYEVHEVKGVKTAVWSIKRKLFLALYPQYKYIVISKGDSRGRRAKGDN